MFKSSPGSTCFRSFEFQESQMDIFHHFTWISGPDFNNFLTVIIFSLVFSQHSSILLASFTIISLYLSKSLRVMVLITSWAIPAQDSMDAVLRKLNVWGTHRSGLYTYCNKSQDGKKRWAQRAVDRKLSKGNGQCQFSTSVISATHMHTHIQTLKERLFMVNFL